MEKLKTTKVCYLEVDYHDLQNLIDEAFPGINFDVVADSEWNNDSQHTINVEGYSKDEFNKTEIDDLIKGNYDDYFGIYSVMDALCVKGLIDPGDYLIRVSW